MEAAYDSIKRIFMAGLVLVFVWACNKSVGNSGSGQFTVYITGGVLNPGHGLTAEYWQNNTIGNLHDTDCFATCIVASGNDIYIGGYNLADSSSRSIYWKNGVRTALTDGSDSGYRAAPNGHFPNSLAVSGSDVYVAGYILQGGSRVAAYWKNGQINIVGGKGSFAESIAVSGSNVYVLGYIGGTPVYWANGVYHVLRSGSPNPAICGITVSGNDVYVAGNSFGPMYWKNDTPVFLSNSLNIGSTSSIAVSGNDVYLSGYTTDSTGLPYALYWKNGISYILGPGAQAFSIGVSGQDVYVAGYSGQDAVYWKNGNKITVAGSAQAYGLFVKNAP